MLILLRLKDLTLDHKTLFRLDREKRLLVHGWSGRKRALGTRPPAAMPQVPNQIVVAVDASLPARWVARELDWIIENWGSFG